MSLSRLCRESFPSASAGSGCIDAVGLIWVRGLGREINLLYGHAARPASSTPAVPRFFFHVYDDIVAEDDEGLLLPDIASAELEAVRGARSLACDQVSDGRLELSHRIDVHDEGGKRLLTVRFAEAIDIRP
jgi:hypothetical protein